jgi:hypothetical protein
MGMVTVDEVMEVVSASTQSREQVRAILARSGPATLDQALGRNVDIDAALTRMILEDLRV